VRLLPRDADLAGTVKEGLEGRSDHEKGEVEEAEWRGEGNVPEDSLLREAG